MCGINDETTPQPVGEGITLPPLEITVALIQTGGAEKVKV
jgi:hypothetical protein